MKLACRFRKSDLRTNLLLALLLCLLACSAGAGAQPEGRRDTLRATTQIDGYSCAKGPVWRHANGHLKQCAVARETLFGEARAPEKSLIVLSPDGTPRYTMLSRPTLVAGALCGGGSWLGPGEGAMTAFYPSGKLKQCYLARDQEIEGIPCMNGGFFGDGRRGGAQFHENGKLASCTLSKDFGGLRRGARYLQAP